ncbi:MAG: hypothetical protein NTZ53_14815 [Cyanobacteria bacterium]|nr:hypothetical protein [Cyanobacteriota bacterium]
MKSFIANKPSFRKSFAQICASIAIAGSSTLIPALFVPASAATLLYDFEEFDLSSYNSLTMTRNGLDITLKRTSNANFDFWDLTSNEPPVPGDWLTRTLYPFNSPQLNDGFLFSLSKGVKAFSIESGDFAPSDFDELTLTAFDDVNGAGNIISTDSFTYGDQGFPIIATLSASSPTIRSVVVTGGSTDYPNSMYWDNVRVGDVPGPLPLLGVAAAFDYSRKLRKRIKGSESLQLAGAID